MRTVVVLAEAARDMELGRDFYERQEEGIGAYFVDSLLGDIESLALFHGIHPLHFGFYRMLATKFPYGCLLRGFHERTCVFAVLDLRRDANWLHEELSGR